VSPEQDKIDNYGSAHASSYYPAKSVPNLDEEYGRPQSENIRRSATNDSYSRTRPLSNYEHYRRPDRDKDMKDRHSYHDDHVRKNYEHTNKFYGNHSQQDYTGSHWRNQDQHGQKVFDDAYGQHRKKAVDEPRNYQAPNGRAFTNHTYMEHTEIRSTDSSDQPSMSSRDPYSSRDSGIPGSLERPSHDSRPKVAGFEAYTKLVTPGFYGAKKPTVLNSEREDNHNESQQQSSSSSQEGGGQQHISAFESYKKSISSPPTNSNHPDSLSNGDFKSQLLDETEENHTVVATARGVFDSNGGILESKETGVSIVIPKGAIPEGISQEIYFKVCQDNSILPPLDKDKGETLLSPLVMCGPHGLKFLQPVELRLPHCASVNPDSWSFALKSSDSPTGV